MTDKENGNSPEVQADMGVLHVGNYTIRSGDLIGIRDLWEWQLRVEDSPSEASIRAHPNRIEYPNRSPEFMVEVTTQGTLRLISGATGKYVNFSAETLSAGDGPNPFKRGTAPIPEDYTVRFEIFGGNADWLYLSAKRNGRVYYLGTREGAYDHLPVWIPAKVEGGATQPPTDRRDGLVIDGEQVCFLFALEKLSKSCVDIFLKSHETLKPRMDPTPVPPTASDNLNITNNDDEPKTVKAKLSLKTAQSWTTSWHWDVGVTVASKTSFNVGMVKEDVDVTVQTKFGGVNQSTGLKDFENSWDRDITCKPHHSTDNTFILTKTTMIQPIRATIRREVTHIHANSPYYYDMIIDAEVKYPQTYEGKFVFGEDKPLD